MAKFNAEYPDSLIKECERRSKNVTKMMSEMTQTGAEVVLSKAKKNAPDSIKPHIKITRTYRTPSDDGINNKVYISGYIPFKPPRTTFRRRNGHTSTAYESKEGIPADFLAIMYEYGRHDNPFPKKPFFRKSFGKRDIEKAMLNVQKKYIGE